MSDTLPSGRQLRTLKLVDDFTRECLAIEVDTSLPGTRVVRVLERLISERGRPKWSWPVFWRLFRLRGMVPGLSHPSLPLRMGHPDLLRKVGHPAAFKPFLLAGRGSSSPR